MKNEKLKVVSKSEPLKTFRAVFVEIIKLYQKILSPHLPKSCRFYPSCSQYSILAIQKNGVWKGIVLGTWRVLRCNPFCKAGIDEP